MPKPPPPGRKPGESPEDLGDTLLTGFEEIPRSEGRPAKEDVGKLLDEELASASGPPASETSQAIDVPEDDGGDRRGGGSSALLKVAFIAALIAFAGAAALVYRNHHRRQVLAQGIARARQLLFLDTHAGYRDASQILEPLAAIDAIDAGSMRAFALSMLALDYRDEAAAQQAESLLMEPERSAAVPSAASLARAALSLARREAGTAAAPLARAAGNPWAGVLQARVAMLAGNLPGAVEPLASALAGPDPLPAGLAVKGDVLRRGRDFAGARAAYLAALKASPGHPRATYGLAKLALSGKIPPAQATEPLRRLLADRSGTPVNERARAALHLAALRGRAGDRVGAVAAMDLLESDLDARSRGWMERAVREESLERSGYRAIGGAPPAVQSSSDDDPYEPPPPPAVEPKKEKKAAAKAGAKAKAKAKAAKAKKGKQKAVKKVAKAKKGKKPPPKKPAP